MGKGSAADSCRHDLEPRRNSALLVLVVQTGLQLSEITALRRLGFVQGRGARVGSEGKGKERGAPLTKSTVAILT